MPFKTTRTTIHPKVAAGGAATVVVAAVVAIAAIFGWAPDEEWQTALAVVVSAILPVLAGYFKTGGSTGIAVDGAGTVAQERRKARRATRRTKR